jgi:predicted NAD/FAD-binding protein
MRRIAIIGAGISGLAAAYFLSRRHQVHVFERNARLGGHTNTVVIKERDGRVALDTGFLVHNDRTYPNLVRLFSELGVATRDSDMSFAVACRGTGLEYSSRGVAGFFAQPRNLLRPSHFRLLGEIIRFNRQAPALLSSGATMTLGEYLDEGRFDAAFRHQYLLPMASAIWSTSLDAVDRFPAQTLVRFFDNHGLLGLTSQPTWKVVADGSHAYIPKLIAPLGDRITLNARIDSVVRDHAGVTLTFEDREPRAFDEVVFACHGDQVRPMLAAPTDAEREVLSCFTTTRNTAVLHTDASVLPARPRAQASWNYLISSERAALPSVTYDLNRLQGLTTRERYCVTLNPTSRIDPFRVIGRYVYHHPLYSLAAIAAQARWAEISGVNRTHYCGAYWGYGFHEDGLTSAQRVARALGVTW